MADRDPIAFTAAQFNAFHELMTGRFESTGHACLFLSAYVGKMLGSSVAAGKATRDEAEAVVAECAKAVRRGFESSLRSGNGRPDGADGVAEGG